MHTILKLEDCVIRKKNRSVRRKERKERRTFKAFTVH